MTSTRRVDMSATGTGMRRSATVTERGRGGDRDHVARLDAQVELLAQRVAKPVGEVDRADGCTPSGGSLDTGGEAFEDAEI